jgi:hypothetical protein
MAWAGLSTPAIHHVLHESEIFGSTRGSSDGAFICLQNILHCIQKLDHERFEYLLLLPIAREISRIEELAPSLVRRAVASQDRLLSSSPIVPLYRVI